MNRVLIIDDDKELCALMKKCIEQENLTALVAYCGAEGLRLVDENKDDRSLTLIILHHAARYRRVSSSEKNQGRK